MLSVQVIGEVQAECLRQTELKAAGRFTHTPADPEVTNLARLAILGEEFGEVARAVVESEGLANDRHDKKIRTELIQVMAVCASWIVGMEVTVP